MLLKTSIFIPSSPDWSLYISLVTEWEESKHFCFGGHVINSRNLFSWLCIDIVWRILMLVTIGTQPVNDPTQSCSYLSFSSHCFVHLQQANKDFSTHQKLIKHKFSYLSIKLLQKALLINVTSFFFWIMRSKSDTNLKKRIQCYVSNNNSSLMNHDFKVGA